MPVCHFLNRWTNGSTNAWRLWSLKSCRFCWRNMAVEHGGDNVRTNTIAPGLIKTYFAKALWDNPEILQVATSRRQ